MIYLDNNATTPIHPTVMEAMLPYLKNEYGNPSSTHQMGQRVRKAIEDVREKIAAFIGTEDPSEIIFTSGATEANNMVIKGLLAHETASKKRAVSTAIEHSSVRQILRYLESAGLIDNVVVPVQPNGIVRPRDVEEAVTPDTILVSVMAANNEVGTLQPVSDIARICKTKSVLFHTDAVQLAGKAPLNVQEMGVDFLSLSAHKFYGPKGIGFLYLRKGTRLESLIHGGSHEKNRRAGTENVSGIIGMGRAVEMAMKKSEKDFRRTKDLRASFETQLTNQLPFVTINGDFNNRINNTSNLCIEYTDSSALAMALDLKGIACSTGSACASGSPDPSHVLLAMGLPQDKAHASLRFSLSDMTTQEEINTAVKIIIETVSKLRETHPLWKQASGH